MNRPVIRVAAVGLDVVAQTPYSIRPLKGSKVAPCDGYALNETEAECKAEYMEQFPDIDEVPAFHNIQALGKPTSLVGVHIP